MLYSGADMTEPVMPDPFEEALQRIKGIEVEVREAKEPFDRTERRHRVRGGLLDERVPERTCPQCGRVVVASRSWVLLELHVRYSWLCADARRVLAVCRSCYWRLRP